MYWDVTSKMMTDSAQWWQSVISFLALHAARHLEPLSRDSRTAKMKQPTMMALRVLKP